MHAAADAAGLADRRAVVAAIALDRPAVVGAGAGDIDLVAALRPMLADPQLAGRGMQRSPLGIAVAIAPDARQGTGAQGRVVGREGAVALQAHHLAEGLGQVLGRAAELALTEGHEQGLVAGEHQARTVMAAAADLGPLAEDHRHVLQGIADQPAARHRRADAAGLGAAARFGIGQIDPGAAGEIGVQRHIEQAALAAGIDGRHAADGGQCAAAVGIAAHQGAGLLGDQQAAIGQLGQAPGTGQIAAQGAQLGRRRRCRRGRRRRRCGPGLGAATTTAGGQHQGKHKGGTQTREGALLGIHGRLPNHAGDHGTASSTRRTGLVTRCAGRMHLNGAEAGDSWRGWHGRSWKEPAGRTPHCPWTRRPD